MQILGKNIKNKIEKSCAQVFKGKMKYWYLLSLGKDKATEN